MHTCHMREKCSVEKKMQGEDHLQELDAGIGNRNIMRGRSDFETQAVETKIEKANESKIWGIER